MFFLEHDVKAFSRHYRLAYAMFYCFGFKIQVFRVNFRRLSFFFFMRVLIAEGYVILPIRVLRTSSFGLPFLLLVLFVVIFFIDGVI